MLKSKYAQNLVKEGYEICSAFEETADGFQPKVWLRLELPKGSVLDSDVAFAKTTKLSDFNLQQEFEAIDNGEFDEMLKECFDNLMDDIKYASDHRYCNMNQKLKE